MELRYLEAVLLLGVGRLGEAERAARQALYLEPSLAVAHLTLGHVLRRLGDTAGARARLPRREAPVRRPATGGGRAPRGGRARGRLAEVARAERERLEAAESRENG